MRKYESASTEKPTEWDTASSPSTVYHNEGITMEEATDESPAMYHYTVTEYTREEYLEKRNADLVAENKILKAKTTIQEERLSMLEDCLLEMGTVVYA